MMAILALRLSIVASAPEIAAAGWAPRLHETLQRAAAVGSDEPFVVPTTGGDPLEPSASKLAPPFVKLPRGAGGEPVAQADLPGTSDEVVEMMTQPTAGPRRRLQTLASLLTCDFDSSTCGFDYHGRCRGGTTSVACAHATKRCRDRLLAATAIRERLVSGGLCRVPVRDVPGKPVGLLGELHRRISDRTRDVPRTRARGLPDAGL